MGISVSRYKIPDKIKGSIKKGMKVRSARVGSVLWTVANVRDNFVYLERERYKSHEGLKEKSMQCFNKISVDKFRKLYVLS